MNTPEINFKNLWKPTLIAAAIAFLYANVLVKLGYDWWTDENYSHGLLRAVRHRFYCLVGIRFDKKGSRKTADFVRFCDYFICDFNALGRNFGRGNFLCREFHSL